MLFAIFTILKFKINLDQHNPQIFRTLIINQWNIRENSYTWIIQIEEKQ